MLDESGVDAADLNAAISEMLMAIYQIVEEDKLDVLDWAGWSVSITDSGGKTLFSVSLSEWPQPAGASRRPRGPE